MAARFKALMTVLNVLSCVGVTIRNDVARLAVDGSYVDAHDGMVLEHEGTYFLYGEAYGNQTLGTPYPWTDWPRLAVYTSPDMVSWTYRGPVLERSQVGGTLWIPNVIYHPPSNRFIMWFGAGGWGTATSTDGIHFEPAVLNQYSRFGPAAGTDGTGVFIDDDGAGYIIFSSSPPGFDHIVSIERLSDDLLTSTNVKVADVFPDRYVESPSLFKHNGHYYATYGSCCCGCNEGSGLVVFTASSVHGPWVRQHPHGDVNCRDASADACGGYGKRSGNLNDLVYHAQWWGPSFIPVVRENNTLSIAVLFSGRRWLSGPNVPAGCNDICGNKGKPDLCLNGGGAYQLRTDLSVWYPLEFDPTSGAVLPLKPLPSFELHLPGDPPGPPPPPGPTPLKLVRVYRCQKPGPDHFASLDPGCEGQQSEGECAASSPASLLALHHPSSYRSCRWAATQSRYPEPLPRAAANRDPRWQVPTVASVPSTVSLTSSPSTGAQQARACTSHL